MTPASRPADTSPSPTSLPLAVRVDLLGDADREVRLQMALGLGEERRHAAAGALVTRFGLERDFLIRETLTWAVLRMPEAALPLVRDALTSARWLARLQAVHTLSKLGAVEDGARLAPLVTDPVDVVAARAYWAVAQCGDPAVIPGLVGELSRGSSAHRNSLTVALSHFGAAAVPALVGALRRGRSVAVRSHAADTLALLGSPDADGAEQALADAVQDPDESVGVASLNALGQLVTPGAWRVIDGMTSAPQPRLALLAGRLTERRPSATTLRRAALRRAPDTPVEDPVASPAPDARSWPAPDPGLVTLEGGAWAAELVPDLALQVAVSRSQHLSRADVPADAVDAVRSAAHERARAGGRSPELAERIAAGSVEQLMHELVLLEQVSVADPGVVVADLLRGTEVRITGFTRLPPRVGSMTEELEPTPEREAYLDSVLIGGRQPVDVTIIDHDPSWADRYRSTASGLLAALGATALRVEHIGSTAVPGLAAKPIIDVLVTVADVTDEAAYVPPMVSAGFELRVREVEHRMLRTPTMDTHVHIYQPTHPAVRDHLDLRQRLREDPADRALYEATKRALAGRRWRDMNDYADAKTEVINAILSRARPGPHP